LSNQQLSALHIPAEEASPEEELIERDSSGSYIIASPGGAPVPGEIREVENEIGMYLPQSGGHRAPE
jgi:hypothetical protein